MQCCDVEYCTCEHKLRTTHGSVRLNTMVAFIEQMTFSRPYRTPRPGETYFRRAKTYCAEVVGRMQSSPLPSLTAGGHTPVNHQPSPLRLHLIPPPRRV